MTSLYPYIPVGKAFVSAPTNDPFMLEAKKVALEESLDDAVKTGSVVVKDGAIIGRKANGSDYHKTHVCERVRRGIPTGQGYELCEGCHPKNHSEQQAVRAAQKNGHDTIGSDLYLWGHWWCCESCWKVMIDGGIRNVYLLENSRALFDKNSPDNILGKWDV